MSMRWLAPCSALLLAGCGMIGSFVPDNTKAQLAEVRSAIVAHDYGAAVEQARELAIKHDDNAEVLFELARAEALLGNEGRALTALEKAIGAGLAGNGSSFRDPAFDEIRRTVRFTAITGRANPEGLNRPVARTNIPEVAPTVAPTAAAPEPQPAARVAAAEPTRRAAPATGDGSIKPIEPLKPLKPTRAGDVEIGDDFVRAGDVDLSGDF